MKREQSRILFITSYFPYGKREPFIENEIAYLANEFSEVIIVPIDADDEYKKDTNRLDKLPKNVLVKNLDLSSKVGIGKLLKPLLAELNHNYSRNKLFNKQNLRRYLGSLKHAGSYLDPFEKFIKENKLSGGLVYSYWGDFWLIPLILLKKKLNLKVVSRFHGYDVYNEVQPNNYFPFKPYILKNLDGVYPISKRGVNYLRDRYKMCNEVKTFYLGIVPHQNKNHLNFEKKHFQVVSCAGMRPVKQIEILIEALALLKLEVQWNHIGDGPLRDKLEEQASTLPENISVKFHGNITNTEVHQFYQDKAIDVFINTSKSEGIPVSIMEALSYGVPIIAPNIGGIAEIVTNTVNGFVLSEKTNPIEVKGAIEEMASLDEQVIRKMRTSARKMWEDNFDASINYPQFIKHIKQL